MITKQISNKKTSNKINSRVFIFYKSDDAVELNIFGTCPCDKSKELYKNIPTLILKRRESL